jgi:Outer membrane receptor proteins, mostly Fe transport
MRRIKVNWGTTPIIFLPFLATASAAQPETVVVTATRLPQAGFDVPASIDAIAGNVIREDNPQVNLSESLNRIPGIVVSNRQNYAQDLQVSSRGFGARSTFGVRGVRLIADGIPATSPDGQGQAATFDLSSADRIEVLRGPFANLYGNSSGGVVQVFTRDGPPQPELDLGYVTGSWGMHRLYALFGGDTRAFNYIADIARFDINGYRDHSAARRDTANVKLRTALGPGTLTFVANGLKQPDTQDPLGLTRTQYEANPRQADPSAIQFNTRKSIDHKQGGLVYDANLTSRDTLTARVYGGKREVEQFLSQTGDTPLGSGGVVDLDRRFGGVGARWTRKLEGERPFNFLVGVDADNQDEHRRGFVNNNGVAGALRRDEDDKVQNDDVYAQGEWLVTPAWTLAAGVRHSRVKFDSKDHYIVGPNPDDSGSVTFSKTVPVGGVLFKASERLHIYANAGQGFETPTFAELAYRPGGATGLNFALQPATSKHYEAGVKARLPFYGMRVNAAVFRIDTDNEIVTNTNVGGRSDFKNASSTRRDGGELSIDAQFDRGFEAHVAYTSMAARFTQPFSSGTPPVTVAAGRWLPGVPGTVFQGELLWRYADAGFHAGVEFRHSSRVYVNEANTDSADSYNVTNLRAGFEQSGQRWRLREFARLDNVMDKRYIGSVIVAAAGGRFFEPAPSRSYAVGIEGSWSFR